MAIHLETATNPCLLCISLHTGIQQFDLLGRTMTSLGDLQANCSAWEATIGYDFPSGQRIYFVHCVRPFYCSFVAGVTSSSVVTTIMW